MAEELKSTRALIVGCGEPPSPELLTLLMDEQTLLLCADGGANTVVDQGFVPDYVVGDMDSVSSATMATLPAERLIKIDADNTGTDLQKVLLHARSLDVRDAILLGFTGRRVDHTLWNLSLLKQFGAVMRLRMIDDHCDIRLIGRSIRFSAPAGQRLSLCPLAGAVEGVHTKGLLFPLKGETLTPGERDGISNEAVEREVEIRVERGDLLLCLQLRYGRGLEWIEILEES